MKRIIFYAIISFGINIYAQSSIQKDIIYLDENMSKIDSIIYKKKCKSTVLKCLEYKKDSLFIIHKVLYKYTFGKISKTETIQLKKPLSINKTFNSQSNIVINYRDSLYDYNARKRNSDRHLKSHDSFKHIALTHKKFNSSRKIWIKQQKKCINKIKNKYNTETFYVYKYDYGSIKHYPDLGWIKDRGNFKTIFFGIMYNFNMLILRPNGEYFLSGGHFSNKMLKNLLKNDWSQYKKDFNDSYNSQNNKGYGLFKTNSSFHKKHCF
jgi:hypothetical protein